MRIFLRDELQTISKNLKWSSSPKLIHSIKKKKNRKRKLTHSQYIDRHHLDFVISGFLTPQNVQNKKWKISRIIWKLP